MRSRSLIALLLLVLVAGCGSEKSAGPKDAGGSAAGGKVVGVKMKDILFVPEKVTARVGETVRWTNDDDIVHTVKAEKGAEFASKALSKGDTYTARMTKAGTIDYVCTIHASQRGTITVVAK